MELEKQVCSLELAKKMKELGFKQFSTFSWVGLETLEEDASLEFQVNERSYNSRHHPAWFFYSAYTVAELGDMFSLVHGITTRKYANEVDGVYFQCTAKNLAGFFVMAKTEADARAKMLIYLKENNLI